MQILELPTKTTLPADYRLLYYRAILPSGWSLFGLRFAWIMVPVTDPYSFFADLGYSASHTPLQYSIYYFVVTLISYRPTNDQVCW